MRILAENLEMAGKLTQAWQLCVDDGKRVRVTMASLMGDVGITTDFSREMGYERRVLVSALSNFAETP